MSNGGPRRLPVVAEADGVADARVAVRERGDEDGREDDGDDRRVEAEALVPPDGPASAAGTAVESAGSDADASRGGLGGPGRRVSTDGGRPAPEPRRRLVHKAGPARFLATFLLSYAFYLFLGDPFSLFDLVTGAATAAVVALALSATLFAEPPTLGRTLPRAARATVFLPYLLYEVARANVGIARVLLDPSLPVDPELVWVRTETREEFERAVLANAVTLTPGTVTVDVRGEEFLVHALTPESRAELEGGRLRRAVGFVFRGRGR